MKVVSFNIRSGNDKASGHSHDERAPRIKALMDKYDPDIIGFQEVVPGLLPHIMEDYSDKYEIFHKYRDERTDIEGCSILWRKGAYELLDKGWFWYSDTPDIPSKGWCDWGHYRFCIWAKLKELATGREFHFFDTHYGFGDQCHVDSTRLIRDYAKALDAKNLVLVGDFNLTYDRPGYKALTEFLVDLNMKTANDRRLTCHGYDINRQGGAPIDFCFISPDTVKPISYHRIDETFDGKFPSDHYGLLLELEILEPIKVSVTNAEAKGLSEDEEAHLARMRSIRNRIKDLNGDIAIVHHCDAVLEEKLMNLKCYETACGIFWRTKRISLVEKLENGVVLKIGERKVAFIKGGKAPEGMPVFNAVTGVTYGSEEYAALRKEYQDTRVTLFPKDLSPTYHGRYQEGVIPSIEDYLFYKGEELVPYTYKAANIASGEKEIADHVSIRAKFTLE